MRMDELKTSEEWSKLCKHIVLDEDGWDRENFQYSWHEERITREEFEKRFLSSTVQFTGPLFDNQQKLISIWKD